MASLFLPYAATFSDFIICCDLCAFDTMLAVNVCVVCKFGVKFDSEYV